MTSKGVNFQPAKRGQNSTGVDNRIGQIHTFNSRRTRQVARVRSNPSVQSSEHRVSSAAVFDESQQAA